MGQYGQLSARQDLETTTSSRVASSSSLNPDCTKRSRASIASATSDASEPVPSIFSSHTAEPAEPEDVVATSSSSTLANRSSKTVATIASGSQASSSQLQTAISGVEELRESQETRAPPRPIAFPAVSKERGETRASNHHNRYSHTPQSFSHMLASGLSHSPNDSRSTSYSHGNVNLSSKQALPDKSSLHHHLYTQGLLAGKHSDISIIAFQHRYGLHRIVLDRAPFFATALSGPWLESSAHEIELFPEDTDQNISQAAFELALKHLYGCNIAADAEAEAIALFATGCWLDMPDLISLSITLILKQLHSDMLSSLIKILSDHYYGRFGERILESAKAMLCRDGWEMPLKHWDGISGDIVSEIIGGDGFFVQGEWERWVLAKRLLDRRLKHLAMELDLLDAKSTVVVRAPHFLIDRSRARDQAATNPHIAGNGKNRELSEDDALWAELYNHPDITAISILLETGIHYIHLDFEQLQYIRGSRDIFDLPVLPDTTISDALWMQMELRQRVVNAKDTELELGLGFMDPAVPLRRAHHDTTVISNPYKSSSASHTEGENAAISEAMSCRGRRATHQSFIVPTSDCNIVWGADDIAMLTSQPRHNRFAENAGNARDNPFENMSAPDPRRFFAYPSQVNNSSWQTPADIRTTTSSPSDPVLRTIYPPFRFAVEFPNPRALKERKRVYSRTIFYGGSLWNIYIQKVRSQKNPQLGVYLHRARERGQADTSLGDAHPVNSSVDDRISTLERDMVTRGRDRGANLGARRTFTRQRSLARRYGHYIPLAANTTTLPEGDTANVSAEQDADSLRSTNTRRTMGRPIVSYPDGQIESYITLDSDSDDDDYVYDGETSWANWSASLRSNLSPSRHLPNPYLGWPMQSGLTRNTAAAGSNASTPAGIDAATASSTRPPASSTASSLPRNQPSHRRSTPTLPPYSDPRPTIKTYFKIYVPSKGGRMLSVYESAPDKFDFSQSWGWRSGSLMLDEGIEGASGGIMSAGEGLSVADLNNSESTRIGVFEPPTAADDSNDGGTGSTTREAQDDRDSRWRRRGEGSLRFMVVIGNL